MGMADFTFCYGCEKHKSKCDCFEDSDLDIIDNKPQKFMRRLFKQHGYCLWYSKQKIPKRIRKTIIYPKYVCVVMNVRKVLKKYYKGDYDYSRAAINIYLELEDRIDDFFFKKRSLVDYNKVPHVIITKEQAIAEQLARGFKPKAQIKDYDPTYGYLQSNADMDLYYPQKFPMGADQREKHKNLPALYLAGELYGVPGHTRCDISTLFPRN